MNQKFEKKKTRQFARKQYKGDGYIYESKFYFFY